MPDVLIRNVEQIDLDRIDARASALGLSRNEYLRRRLVQDAARVEAPAVTADDLREFGERTADLGDRAVMRGAWS